MTSSATHTIPARSGRAVFLPKNHRIRIINTHGTQVVDFWAFTASGPELRTVLSLPHTRARTLHLQPRVPDILTDNLRAPLLQLTADRSPGGHDTLIAACDAARYAEPGLGLSAGEAAAHASCAANLRAALADLGVPWPADGGALVRHWTPAPLNLFMHVPVAAGGALSFQPPLSQPGDHVELTALADGVVVVMSCCPQDRLPVNGAECVPQGVEFAVLPP